MIENSRRSEKTGIRYGRKEYYLISNGNKPEGMCTKIETAWACAEELAKKHKAVPIGNSKTLYIYEDEVGEHFITIQMFRKMMYGTIKDDE